MLTALLLVLLTTMLLLLTTTMLLLLPLTTMLLLLPLTLLLLLLLLTTTTMLLRVLLTTLSLVVLMTVLLLLLLLLGSGLRPAGSRALANRQFGGIPTRRSPMTWQLRVARPSAAGQVTSTCGSSASKRSPSM